MTSVLTRPATATATPAHPTSADVETSARTDSRTGGRVWYFDHLRLIATVGVVLIHAATQPYTAGNGGGSGLWTFVDGATGEALGRFAVGCFFLISGALLLDPRHRFRLRHSLARVGIPLLVWSLVYLAVQRWYVAIGWHTIESPAQLGFTASGFDAGGVVKALAGATVANHFWFVYALLGCYLMLPLLRPLTALPDATAKRLLEYALALWLVADVALPTVEHFWPGTLPVYGETIDALPATYLGFVVLGYYLHRYGLRLGRWQPGTRPLAVTAALSVVAIVATDVTERVTHGTTTGWAQTNGTPAVVLLAATVFLLAKRHLNRPSQFVSLFSRLSFRIYLVHMLVLWWLRWQSPISGLYRDSAIASTLLITAVTLAVSFVIAAAMDRVPVLRRYA